MDPISALTILSKAKDVFSFVLKNIKIILPLVLIIIVILYCWKKVEDIREKAYKDGYNTAVAEMVEENRVAQETIHNEYEILLKDAHDRLDAANEISRAANNKALAERERANRFQSLYQGALRDVPLIGSDVTRPFSNGFVGLHTLAVQGKLASGTDEYLGETEGAGRPDLQAVRTSIQSFIGSAGYDPSATSQVTQLELLVVDSYNYSIANTCLSERKQLREALHAICDKGYCKY